MRRQFSLLPAIVDRIDVLNLFNFFPKKHLLLEQLKVSVKVKMYPMTRKKMDNQTRNNLQMFNVTAIFEIFKSSCKKPFLQYICYW